MNVNFYCFDLPFASALAWLWLTVAGSLTCRFVVSSRRKHFTWHPRRRRRRRLSFVGSS